MSEFVETPDYETVEQLKAGMRNQFEEEVVRARSDLTKAVLANDTEKLEILLLSMRLSARDIFDAKLLAEKNGNKEMAKFLQPYSQVYR